MNRLAYVWLFTEQLPITPGRDKLSRTDKITYYM